MPTCCAGVLNDPLYPSPPPVSELNVSGFSATSSATNLNKQEAANKKDEEEKRKALDASLAKQVRNTAVAWGRSTVVAQVAVICKQLRCKNEDR